jgi:hypothetical protein
VRNKFEYDITANIYINWLELEGHFDSSSQLIYMVGSISYSNLLTTLYVTR